MTKDPQHILADAFLEMAQAARKIDHVLTQYPFLNRDIPDGWPIPTCAYEFAIECYGMVDHYTGMLEHIDLVLTGAAKAPSKRTKKEREALSLAVEMLGQHAASADDDDARCRCGKFERNCDC
jgi:hypothetical protein